VEGISTVRVYPDRRALLGIFAALDGSSWRNRDNWWTGAPLHEWYGVTTDSKGNVVALELPANGLAGALPAAVGALGALDRLLLSANGLTGPIPSELGNLGKLSSDLFAW